MGVLTWHFLWCTVLGCAGVLSAYAQRLAVWAVPRDAGAEALRAESLSLRRALAEVSAAHDFPRWARLQRRVQATAEEHKQRASEQEARGRALGCVVWLALEALAALGTLWYACSAGAAAASLPPHLTGALGAVLAAPGCGAGQVSALAWLLLVRGAVTAVSPPRPDSPGVKGLYSLASTIGLL